MELDSFLASPRWDILQIISKCPSSPTEIAEKLNTTISFVSQQLKLLEAAGIVKKRRTGTIERGKPRTLFSLSKEFVYIIPLSGSLDEKKVLEIDRDILVTLRVWSLSDKKIHSPLLKIYWSLHPVIDEIISLKLDLRSLVPKLFIVIEDSPSQKLLSIMKRIESEIKIEIVKFKVALKTLSEIPSLYESEKGTNDLKGGSSIK